MPLCPDQSKIISQPNDTKKLIMRRLLTLLTAFLLLAVVTAHGQRTAIVPQPVSLTEKPGEFTLTQRTTISAPADLARYAEYLRDRIDAATGWQLAVSKSNAKADIRLSVDSAKVDVPKGTRSMSLPRRLPSPVPMRADSIMAYRRCFSFSRSRYMPTLRRAA